MAYDAEHCRHCTDPDAPYHDDPQLAWNEAACAFYEHPENLAIKDDDEPQA